MPATHSPFAAVIAKIGHLQQERDKLVHRIGEIDAQLGSIASQLGLASMPAPEPIPLADIPKPDARSAGTMSERAMEILRDADAGLTRTQLKELLREDQRFERQLSRNPNGFYNMVVRFKRLGRVKEIGDLLYLAERVPPEPTADVVQLNPSQRRLEI